MNMNMDNKKMNVDYIVVQAGGKGSRLEYLTKNKPKALVPIENLPMLFHLFKKFPQKKYIIIGDYKKEVLREYLRCFAEVKYIFVETTDYGTCAGIKDSLSYIPKGHAFMLIWSDLILSEQFELPELFDNYIGISRDFECRWSYINDRFEEQKSFDNGVSGLFIFKDKVSLNGIEENGEFVKYLQNTNIRFQRINLSGTKEFGLLSEYKKLANKKCRPFNKIIDDGDRIIKEGINQQGKKLAIREQEWYKAVKSKDYEKIPEIFSDMPLIMEKINGKNIYEYNLSKEEQRQLLEKLIFSLKQLHTLDECDMDVFSMQDAYFTKTTKRLSMVRNLIPFSNNRFITVNGRKCRNTYFYLEQLESKINELCTSEKFKLIHGDCTFSNLILKEDTEPILIDPRGYFGYTEIYGDPDYDWAKLYYSIVGNYDQFNLKRFSLDISEEKVCLMIESNGWEDMQEYFFTLLPQVSVEKIKLIHAIIWLSLTTYAWEDYDSICAAFYNGIYYLEEVL